MSNDSLNKKVKLVYYDLEGNLATESIWTEKDGEYYKVKNIPFFAPNLAYNDVISVEDDDGELFFDSLISASGHSTIQIIFFNIKYFDQVVAQMEKLGCSWEGSHIKEYISVDVPKEIEYKDIRDFLDRGRQDKIFDFKEACLAHAV